MDYALFPVNSTNIFPLANSTAGGQLVTEYNLRSRESVDTDPNVSYMVGPSFVHSEADFEVTVSDTSSTVIEISPGRGVIDGHFIELLTPILIDLSAYRHPATASTPYEGKLSVGIRIYYSTEATMSGSTTAGMYQGIKIVVLPASKFKVPSDVPNNPNAVTAHLKLADVTYLNGGVSSNSIINNPDKCKHIYADRIFNVEGLFNENYLETTNLSPDMLYVISGKSKAPCEAADSLMIWDANPELTNEDPDINSPTFSPNPDGSVSLVIPHKQLDGGIDNDDHKYYKPTNLKFPKADFGLFTPGMISPAYTERIHTIQRRLHDIYKLPNGKQVGYQSILQSAEDGSDSKNLPVLQAAWNIGDYILIGQDYSLSMSGPASLYVVVPGVVGGVELSVSEDCKGQMLASLEKGIYVGSDSDKDNWNNYFHNPGSSGYIEEELAPNYSGYRGVAGDYFKLHAYSDSASSESYDEEFYYKVTSNNKVYSDLPIRLTSDFQLASETDIGGFRNVPETALNEGYVRLDPETGYLKLMDYEILRTGVLAYQLGGDYVVPAGLDAEEIQSLLDEYVNQRVAFPNYVHSKTAEDPNVITITLNLPRFENKGEINLYDIDCRFNTSILLRLVGNADSNTVLNISDCKKIRIEAGALSQAEDCRPIINLYRSNLYYDPDILNRLKTPVIIDSESVYPVIRDLGLWYEKLDEYGADLVVDGMTVRGLDRAKITSESGSFWSLTESNDNHYRYALESITFNAEGDIVRCGMYINTETTSVAADSQAVKVESFRLPQGGGLVYPEKCLTKPLTVTGEFVASYTPTGSSKNCIIDTSFTARTQCWNHVEASEDAGSILLFIKTYEIESGAAANDSDVLEPWRLGAYHLFQGGAQG